MGQMFTIEEMLRKARGTQYESPAMHDPSFDLRETIQIFFVRAFRDGYKRHSIKLKGDSPNDEARISVLIKSLRKTAKGLPLLELVYVDHARARVLLSARKIDLEGSLHRFLAAVQSVDGHAEWHNVMVSEAELGLLRKLLGDNGARAKASPWQRRHTTGPECRASYVVPVFGSERKRFPGREGDGPSVEELVRSLQRESSEMRDDATGEELAEAMRGLETGEYPAGGAFGGRTGSRSLREEKPTGQGKNKGASSGRQGKGSGAKGVAKGKISAEVGLGRGGDAVEEDACANCGLKAGGPSSPVLLKKCSRCRRVKYCSTSCQKAAWAGHKAHCTEQR
jgi:hypothetical protein